MADIRSYDKEKKKRESAKSKAKGNLRLVKSESDESFEEKLRKHRVSYLYRILLIAIAIIGILILVLVQYQKKVYTDYDVVSEHAIQVAPGTTMARLGKNILFYSTDGAYCVDADGTVLWNQTYEMQYPVLDINGEVLALADYHGRTVYIYNEEKHCGTITTNLPLTNLTVAQNGIVAAILEDDDVTWIYVYDTTGKELVKFRTMMKNTGYPVSVSLSPDALLCAVSYLYVDAGIMKSSVAFYNFDEYGQNQIDNLVGGYDYTDKLVPYVRFMTDTRAFALGDDCIVFYGGSQKPEVLAIHYFNTEIRGVYYNENYVGVVFYNDMGGDRFRMEIYDASGKKVRTQDFALDYTDILFDEESFIIYNEEECIVTTMDGVQKYNGPFKKAVTLLNRGNGGYRYLMLTQDSLDVIQMR